MNSPECIAVRSCVSSVAAVAVDTYAELSHYISITWMDGSLEAIALLWVETVTLLRYICTATSLVPRPNRQLPVAAWDRD